MPDPTATARKLLKAINGVHVGAEIEPGKILSTKDVIEVCEALLPPPGAAMSRAEAASIIAEHSGVPAGDILASHAVRIEAYRKAASRTHPDVGGDPQDSKRVNAARMVLEQA